MENNYLFLNSADVENLLRISKRTLQNYRSDGRLPYLKISKKNILYRAEDVLTFLENSSSVSYQKIRGKALIKKYIIKM